MREIRRKMRRKTWKGTRERNKEENRGDKEMEENRESGFLTPPPQADGGLKSIRSLDIRNRNLAAT
ncbi:hypothetical protein LguiB_021628 [Lonicera macranthoides]